MKVFVTAAPDFIGSNFVRHIIRTSDDEVRCSTPSTTPAILANLRDIGERQR